MTPVPLRTKSGAVTRWRFRAAASSCSKKSLMSLMADSTARTGSFGRYAFGRNRLTATRWTPGLTEGRPPCRRTGAALCHNWAAFASCPTVSRGRLSLAPLSPGRDNDGRRDNDGWRGREMTPQPGERDHHESAKERKQIGRPTMSRREFLKSVLAAGTLGALSSAVPVPALRTARAANAAPARAASARWKPTEPPNQPIGVAQGIFPGRVSWVHDPKSAQVGRRPAERRLVRGQVQRPGPGRCDAPPVGAAPLRREDGRGGMGGPVPALQPDARTRRRRLQAGRESGREAQHELLQPARRFRPGAVQHAASDQGPVAATRAGGGRARVGPGRLRRLALHQRFRSSCPFTPSFPASASRTARAATAVSRSSPTRRSPCTSAIPPRRTTARPTCPPA